MITVSRRGTYLVPIFEHITHVTLETCEEDVRKMTRNFTRWEVTLVSSLDMQRIKDEYSQKNRSPLGQPIYACYRRYSDRGELELFPAPLDEQRLQITHVTTHRWE